MAESRYLLLLSCAVHRRDAMLGASNSAADLVEQSPESPLNTAEPEVSSSGNCFRGLVVPDDENPLV